MHPSGEEYHRRWQSAASVLPSLWPHSLVYFMSTIKVYTGGTSWNAPAMPFHQHKNWCKNQYCDSVALPVTSNTLRLPSHGQILQSQLHPN